MGFCISTVSVFDRTTIFVIPLDIKHSGFNNNKLHINAIIRDMAGK